jgi:hypothetical protein
MSPEMSTRLTKDQIIETVKFRVLKKEGLHPSSVEGYIAENLGYPSFEDLYAVPNFNWLGLLRDYESEQEIHNRSYFSAKGVDRASLWPTPVMLKKSIADATFPIRLLLKEHEIHDFILQAQGPEHKVVVDALMVGETIIKTRLSLYRPVTKQGDPRLWFSGMKNFCEPGDELAIAIHDKDIFLFNFTRYDYATLLQPGGTLSHISALNFLAAKYSLSPSAQKLWDALKPAAKTPFRGPHQTTAHNSTDVGMAVEAFLGIPPNSSKNPDFEGIELKSGRAQLSDRHALFVQVPDWNISQNISKIHSIREFVEQVGYKVREQEKINALGTNAKELRCTVSALRPNAQLLQLRVEENKDQLIEFQAKSNQTKERDLLVWTGDVLRNRLREKHPETFWIEALSSTDENGFENFKITKITYTRSPLIAQFMSLIEQGKITLDHMIGYKKKVRKNSQGVTEIKWAISEKGPSFKIRDEDIPLLFPSVQELPLD